MIKLVSRPSFMIFAVLAMLILAGCSPAGAPAKIEVKNTVSPPTAASKGAGGWEEKWNKTVSEAKKEGELTIYTTFSGEVVRKIMGAFQERYGISASVISARGPELIQRLETQRRAGLNAVDAFIAGGTNIVTLMKPLGYVDRIDEVLILPEVTDPKAWRSGGIDYFDKEHYGIAMIASFNKYALRNTELVKENEITSHKDLVKPRWKGKIAIHDPTITGAGNAIVGFLAEVWGVAETREFLQQLVKQDLGITRDQRQVVEWVSRGKYEVGLGTSQEQVSDFLKLGAPIYPVKVAEGGMVTSSSGGIGIVNKRPNPNATTVFVNWLLSREGHAVLVNNTGLPGARVDAPTEGIPAIFFPEPGEKVLISTEQSWILQNEMLKVAAEVLGPLVK